MREGWAVRKLGEIVSFQRGLTYSKSDEVDRSSNVILRANNIDLDSNKLDLTELKYINDTIIIPDNKKVIKGSLIICISSGSKNHLGKVALIDKEYDFAFGGFMGQLIPSNLVDAKYLYYSLISDSYKQFISNLSDGVNINNLKFDDLKGYSIPLPEISEQKRIVAILNDVFLTIEKAKENTEKNLQNARELFESYLQGAFTDTDANWTERNLEDLIEIKHGFAFKSEFYSDQGDYVLLTPGNFYEEGGYRDRGDKQKYYVGDIPRNYILNKGDLLIAMTEQAAGLLGSPVIIPESDKFLHNQRLGLVIHKQQKEVDNRFLFHLFNTKKIRELIHDSASGVKVRHTSPAKILRLNVYIPPYYVQESIVAKLETLSTAVKKLEAIYEKKLTDLQELKKNILQKALNGELTEV